MAFDLGDYVDVSERLAALREKYPDAAVRPADPHVPFQVVTIGGQTFVAVVAACYRNADDRNPGVGMAWEPVPGLTPYTKNSELQNAETSAWGRAIVAALVADTKRGVSSRNEVRNRREEQDDPFVPATRLSAIPTPLVDKAKRDAIKGAIELSEDPVAVKAGWKDVPLPALAKLTVDLLPTALDYLASVDVVIESLPTQTAVEGCPHCGLEITAENMVVSWPDPFTDEDPPPMVAGCQSCEPM
jgi:hypothetical protein